MCDDTRSRYDAAIRYFENAITEAAEIIEEHSDNFEEKMLLIDQRRHFIIAVAALKACRDIGSRHG